MKRAPPVGRLEVARTKRKWRLLTVASTEVDLSCSRRRWLGSSAVLLGAHLLEALATPLWRWTGTPAVQAIQGPHPEAPSAVTFVDVAKEAGLNVLNVWGGVKHKKYIIEAKGSGLAFFDYDQDGWLDIYLTNGQRMPGQESHPGGTPPTQHLFKNNRDGTFTDVTEKSGLGRTGWGTGVCVGDYDNDGWDDLFCTYWGHNILWHNNGNGTFTDVTKKAGLWEDRVRWGSGCTWIDYNRDGFLDLFVCNYIDLDLEKVPAPGQTNYCQWKGMPTLCGPRGLAAGSNILYHNNGNGFFTDVSKEAGILKPGPRYSITAVSYDFDNDGWPDIYVAVDSEPSILFHNRRDGTFEDSAVAAGCAYNDEGQEQAGMGVAVGDYDGDGWLDIYKTNFSDDTPDLYHNNGDGTFTDQSFAAGLAVNTQYVCWGTGFMDYDNDGWIDIFQVCGHVYPEIEEYHLLLGWPYTLSMSAGAPALWTMTTMVGSTSSKSAVTSIQRLRNIIWMPSLFSRGSCTVTSEMANSRTYRKSWAPVWQNDFPVAVVLSAILITMVI